MPKQPTGPWSNAVRRTNPSHPSHSIGRVQSCPIHLQEKAIAFKNKSIKINKQQNVFIPHSTRTPSHGLQKAPQHVHLSRPCCRQQSGAGCTAFAAFATRWTRWTRILCNFQASIPKDRSKQPSHPWFPTCLAHALKASKSGYMRYEHLPCDKRGGHMVA